MRRRRRRALPPYLGLAWWGALPYHLRPMALPLELTKAAGPLARRHAMLCAEGILHPMAAACHVPCPRRFVLLDRDGTINVERCYLTDPADLELLPRTAAGLRRLGDLGLGLVVITNQSAVGRGLMDEGRLQLIHQRLQSMLAEEGVRLDGIYYCPHVSEAGCTCRKPAPGLARRAAAEHGFDLPQCIVVGDKPCDLLLGRAIGAATILVRTGYGQQTEAAGRASSDAVADDLLHAASIIAGWLEVDTEARQVQ